MKDTIFNTGNDWTGLVIRLAIGIVLFPHGAQKLLGWFGGYGFSGTMNYFTDTRHFPYIMGLLVILIESVGALSIIAGFATRIWAAAIIILMIGIIFSSHVNNGFFMNWYVEQKGEGYEYHLLMIGLCVASLLNGAGRLSVDRLLTK